MVRCKEILWAKGDETNQNVLNEFIKKVENKGYSIKDLKYRVMDTYSHVLVLFEKTNNLAPTEKSNNGEPVNVEKEVDDEWE